MLKISDKVVSKLADVLSHSESWGARHKNGEDIFVRLDILSEEGKKDEFDYKFSMEDEKGNDDIVIEKNGIKFAYPKSAENVMSKTDIDYTEEDGRSGITFNYNEAEG